MHVPDSHFTFLRPNGKNTGARYDERTDGFTRWVREKAVALIDMNLMGAHITVNRSAIYEINVMDIAVGTVPVILEISNMEFRLVSVLPEIKDGVCMQSERGVYGTLNGTKVTLGFVSDSKYACPLISDVSLSIVTIDVVVGQQSVIVEVFGSDSEARVVMSLCRG